MLYSYCVIAKNEEATFPRLAASLKNFQERGGVCCLMDTGSTDNTVQLAKDAGWIVEEVGDMFQHTIDKDLAEKINAQFIVEGEAECVQEGDKYFDFAAARNHCAKMSPTDWVFWADADEQVSVMDIDKINSIIEQNCCDHFTYEFVFAHREDGTPAVQFIQSKAYKKSCMEWRGLVHEMIQPLDPSDAKGEMYLASDVFLLEHFQQPHDRHSYLKGLMVGCYLHPQDDRWSHYAARELMWGGRPRSAIKEFERHVAMNRWPAERSQSCVFIGDCYGKLNQPEDQVLWYMKGFHIDSSRREPLIRLAQFYKHNHNPQAAKCFAIASLEIPWHGFYANNKDHYEHEPYEILYWACGWMGDIEGAQTYLTKALEYRPNHPQYLHDKQFYF